MRAPPLDEAATALEDRLQAGEELNQALVAVRAEFGLGPMLLVKVVQRVCRCSHRDAARAVARATYDPQRYRSP